MPLAIELTDVRAQYGNMPALFGIDVAVPKGSVVAFLGPNGAGKTTTLRVITGLLSPSAGSIDLHGENITKNGIRERARKGLCSIPEGRGIFPSLTVRENLLLHTHIVGPKAWGEIQSIAYGRFPILEKRKNQLAGTLSGGEQQMLAMSRALTTDPSVILFDEISMGLAPLIVEDLFQVVRDLASEGRTIVLVEQFVDDALDISDYVYLFNQGRIRAVGEPDDIREEIVSSYLGGSHGSAGPQEGLEGLNDSDLRKLGPREVVKPERSSQRVMTARGTLIHRTTCPIAVNRHDLRPVDLEGDRRPCGICRPFEES